MLIQILFKRDNRNKLMYLINNIDAVRSRIPQFGQEGTTQKNHRPYKEGGEYRIVLYQQLQRITTAVRRKRLNFYGSVVRMDNRRLASRVFNTVSRRKAT